MKFLLFIIIFNTFAQVSFSNLIDPIMNDLTVNKFVLPDEDKIKNVDTKLIVRISLPKNGLKGKYSGGDSFINFNSEDDDNFLITKLDFTGMIKKFHVRNVILNFDRFWRGSFSTGNDLTHELIIFLTNEDNKLKNEDIIVSIPIESIDLKYNDSTKVLDDELSKFLKMNDDNKFPLLDILNAVEQKFIYYKNKKENINVNHIIFFKNSIKISSNFAKNLDNINEDAYADFRKINLLINNYKNKKNKNLKLPRRDFVNFKSKDLNLMNIIEIDPEDLVRNYLIPKKVVDSLNLNLDDFKNYVKNTHSFEPNTSQKILISQLLDYVLASKYFNKKLNDNLITDEFDNIYDKYFKISNEKVLNNTHSHEIIKNIVLNTNWTNFTITSNSSNSNETYDINKNESITIKSDEIGFSEFSNFSDFNDFKNFLNKNETKDNLLFPKLNIPKIFNFYKTPQINSNLTRIKKFIDNIKLKSKNHIIDHLKEDNTIIKLNRTQNQTNKIQNNNQFQKKTIVNINNDIKNFTESTNLVDTHIQSNLTNINDLENKNLNKSNQPIEKLKLSSSHSPRFLKNEKVKYINGTLLVIQTMMVPGRNDNFAEVNEEFNKIINNGFK